MHYIFLPVYNEEAALGAVIASLDAVSAKVKTPFHILVVNDGSTDGTGRVLDAFRDRDGFTVLSHERNRGIDAVFRTGIEFLAAHASADDTMVLMEADDTNDVASLPPMLSALKDGHDIVIASRFVPGGRLIGFPFWRSIPCRIVNRMLRAIFAVEHVTDYTIFFRGYSMGLLKRGVEAYGSRLIETVGFVANAEILLKLSALGPRIHEVPLVYRYNLKQSKSKLKIAFTIRQYLKLIMNRDHQRRIPAAP
jgi:dolichol-phosphate mannosyltransferase